MTTKTTIEPTCLGPVTAVRVHCGSAYVRGNARRYRYLIAQLFELVQRASGRQSFQATGIVVGPFRSAVKCETEGRRLAAKYGAQYVPGYGSLHGADPLA